MIGPEHGATLPGMTVVCGDCTPARTARSAVSRIGIGTSEVEHVLATQCLLTKKSRNMLVLVEGRLGRGVTAKDLALAVIGRIGTAGGSGYAIEYAGAAMRALSMEGRMTLCNMAIEAGARCGHGGGRRDDDRLPQGPAVRAEGRRCGNGPSRHGGRCAATTTRKFDRVVTLDAREIRPQVTWGTSPEMVLPVDGRVPDPDQERDPVRRDGIERALAYMALEPNMPLTDIRIDKVFIGSCTNSRIEDLRAAAAVVRGRRVASNVRLAMVVPGSGRVKVQAEREGLDRIFLDAGFEWREPGLLDVPRHERRPARARRALRIDLESELRGPAGAGRAHPPGEPGDGGGGRGVRAFRRRARRWRLNAAWKNSPSCNGLVAPLDRANVDTDAIIPKQFLKSIKRTGFGPNLFDAWRYLDIGEPGMDNAKRQLNPDFVLNQPHYQRRVDPARAQELRLRLLARARAVGAAGLRLPGGHRAQSFADIFFNNCFKNGLLPIVLARARSIACSTRSRRSPASAIDRPRRADGGDARRRKRVPLRHRPVPQALPAQRARRDRAHAPPRRRRSGRSRSIGAPSTRGSFE